MKGIILSGGKGNRLYPLTISCNKQLLPVYDKPMIYYPVSTLLHLGIRDIQIISSPEYIKMYSYLLGNGSKIGIHISYVVQNFPRGLPEAFTLSEDFIGKNYTEDVFMILGDNIFHGNFHLVDGPQIFAYKVKNPSDYAVVVFKDGKVLSIEEKPQKPKSKHVVPGLYKLDRNAIEYSKRLIPSTRRELEIVELLKIYIDNENLNISVLPEGFVWLDAGTPFMLHLASSYVQTMQDRQGRKIACLEEDAYKLGFINKDAFKDIVYNTPDGEYKEYLEQLL